MSVLLLLASLPNFRLRYVCITRTATLNLHYLYGAGRTKPGGTASAVHASSTVTTFGLRKAHQVVVWANWIWKDGTNYLQLFGVVSHALILFFLRFLQAAPEPQGTAPQGGPICIFACFQPAWFQPASFRRIWHYENSAWAMRFLLATTTRHRRPRRIDLRCLTPDV